MFPWQPAANYRKLSGFQCMHGYDLKKFKQDQIQVLIYRTHVTMLIVSRVATATQVNVSIYFCLCI